MRGSETAECQGKVSCEEAAYTSKNRCAKHVTSASVHPVWVRCVGMAKRFGSGSVYTPPVPVHKAAGKARTAPRGSSAGLGNLVPCVDVLRAAHGHPAIRAQTGGQRHARRGVAPAQSLLARPATARSLRNLTQACAFIAVWLSQVLLAGASQRTRQAPRAPRLCTTEPLCGGHKPLRASRCLPLCPRARDFVARARTCTALTPRRPAKP